MLEYMRESFWQERAIAAVLRGNRDEATTALLELTGNSDDREWTEGFLQYVFLSEELDHQVRSLCLTCLGHIARLHRELDMSSVLLLQAVKRQKDTDFGIVAWHALDDYKSFAKKKE